MLNEKLVYERIGSGVVIENYSCIYNNKKKITELNYQTEKEYLRLNILNFFYTKFSIFILLFSL
jgi:hypothetical protein